MAPRPGGRQLHARRIDAGQESQRNAERQPLGHEGESCVRPGAKESGYSEQTPGVDHVRQIEKRAQKRAGYEAYLHRYGEPGGARSGEAPLFFQGRHNRGRAEPQGHAQQLGERKGSQRPPLNSGPFDLVVGCGGGAFGV